MCQRKIRIGTGRRGTLSSKLAGNIDQFGRTQFRAMIFGSILSRQGGGWLLRTLYVRKAVVERFWRTKDTRPFPPLTLFDFARAHDAIDASRVLEKESDTWRISDDRVIGGFSSGSAVLFTSPADYRRYASGVVQPADAEADQQTNEAEEVEEEERGFVPFLRWKGSIDTTLGLQSKSDRSGFASLRSPRFAFNGANLKGMYAALELTCRSDGRVYTVNLSLVTLSPYNIYQARIQTQEKPDGPFERFVVPFDQFTLMGSNRGSVPLEDDDVKIESVGITLMDGKDGDFSFDLARIRAVNYTGNLIVYEGPSEED